MRAICTIATCNESVDRACWRGGRWGVALGSELAGLVRGGGRGQRWRLRSEVACASRPAIRPAAARHSPARSGEWQPIRPDSSPYGRPVRQMAGGRREPGLIRQPGQANRVRAFRFQPHSPDWAGKWAGGAVGAVGVAGAVGAAGAGDRQIQAAGRADGRQLEVAGKADGRQLQAAGKAGDRQLQAGPVADPERGSASRRWQISASGRARVGAGPARLNDGDYERAKVR